MTNAEAWFNKSLRPRKPEGSLGRTAQDVHLDSHTAPELWHHGRKKSYSFIPLPFLSPSLISRMVSVEVKNHVYLLQIHTPPSPSLISRMDSVDVKHYVYLLHIYIPPPPPRSPSLISRMVSVDIKHHVYISHLHTHPRP